MVAFRPLPVLDAAIVEAATGSASGEVIGFYRTTPVCGVPMRDEDKALAANSFRHPTSVFLLVEAGKSGIGEARFCFWGEGELFDWPLMLFPFDAEELAVEEMRRRSSKLAPGSHAGLAPVASAADVKAGTLSEVGAVRDYPPRRRRKRRRAPRPKSKATAVKPPREGGRRWLVPVLATIVVVLLLAGGFLNFRISDESSTPPAVAFVGSGSRRSEEYRSGWLSSGAATTCEFRGIAVRR